jgi:hypothetical protein
MRVVKNGCGVEKETQCPHCNSIIAYTENDIVTNTGMESDASLCRSPHIRCPVCSRKIIL